MLRSQFCLLVLTSAAGRAAAQGPSERLTLGAFTLELTAVWERLTDTTYKFEQKYPLVRDLKPAAERARYTAEQFRPFLPEAPVAVGDTWRVDATAALPFLRQFHPGATAELHHDGGFGVSAPGAWGCLRLLTAEHAEVWLRVHADFLIAGQGRRQDSSWFTPAQFRGRMLIDRKRGEVIAFTLGVPAGGVNVDVNIADKNGIAADIGRIPRMELAGGTWPARPASAPQSTADARQITAAQAEDRLARRFYPFAEIAWLDLPAARAQSLATGKPLHVVALFGSLMDESC